MTTHVGIMILFALFVSAVFAALMRNDPTDQLRLGLRLFGTLVGAAILAGWLLYSFPL